ncbi:SAVED domain-containing protein [Candidatus Methanodesulfokora washburnensis]|jgi:hypothetical protein|uniref:SAVED domain-containing protein n=1 Tax=Candidatus Methanodesulfokora washburnensis TaxID=2478471 RepID=A0A3R9PI36_9CREN|nr:SAVED domain-containing protein [Candidatus Methanodesulfokores washburnensis]
MIPQPVKRESTLRILIGEISGNIDLMVLLMYIIASLISPFLSPYFTLWGFSLLPTILYIIFFFYFVYRLKEEISAVISEKHLPVIFVTGERDVNRKQRVIQAENAIKRVTGFDKFGMIERHFHIDLSRAVYWKRTPSGEWINYIEDGIEMIKCLYYEIRGRKVYHLFLGRPSVIALGLGAILGRAIIESPPVIVYHEDGGEYRPVLDLSRDPGRIRERISGKQYKYIKVDLPKNIGDEVVLALEMTRHPLMTELRNYISENNITAPVILVKNTYGGDLKDEDWTRPVQELYNLILDLRDMGVRRFHLFIGMHEAMAFGLGYALGSYWDIKVYKLVKERSTYELVFSLNELPELSLE